MNRASGKVVAAAMDEASLAAVSDEAVRRILLFLPVADIARCRAVCQHWRDMIDDADHFHDKRPYCSTIVLRFDRGGTNLDEASREILRCLSIADISNTHAVYWREMIDDDVDHMEIGFARPAESAEARIKVYARDSSSTVMVLRFQGGGSALEDIVREVLIRLPVAHIIRSREVCWPEMIDDAEHFHIAFTRRNRPEPLQLAVEDIGASPHELFTSADGPLNSIITCLPVRDVLRVRTVSTIWRRIIDSGGFRNRYHLSRSPMPLFFLRRNFDRGEEEPHLDNTTARVELQGVDLAGGEAREIIRFKDILAPDHLECDSVFKLHGSCDGILLLSYKKLLLACNPFTRRSTRLPTIHLQGSTILGFYACVSPLTSNTEYRLLYRVDTKGSISYRIITLSEYCRSRLIAGNKLPQEDTLWSDEKLCSNETIDPPVTIGTTLFWRPEQRGGTVTTFDTTAEDFGWITSLPVREKLQGPLSEIDKQLGMSCIDGDAINVWVFSNGTWTNRYRFVLLQPGGSLVDAFSETPLSVLHLNENFHLLVQGLYHLLQCTSDGVVLQRHSRDNYFILLTHHQVLVSMDGSEFLHSNLDGGNSLFKVD